MKAFLIDVNICNGCYCCQISCKDEYCGNDWTPYSKPEPITGQFWGKLNEYVRGQNSHVKASYVFLPCQHCANPPCVPGCPYQAIYARNDGLVIIDPIKCTGCQVCLSPEVCPYNVIYFDGNQHIAQKCTGCAHLVDRNEIFATRCADSCPTLAIKFGDDSSLTLTGSEFLHPEFNTSPRVHYLGLPKRFIAGTVFDSSKQEVVIGATCTLSGAGSGTATTNDFGDFWIDGLAAGKYTLTIAASGYSTKTVSVDTTSQDIGLADIALA